VLSVERGRQHGRRFRGKGQGEVGHEREV
jgi:hypothetical protein